MIDGITVDIGGTDYIIPPLNFKALINIDGDIKSLAQPDKGFLSVEKINSMINIIYFALLRNYPDITKDDIQTMVDIKNSHQVIHTILQASGYTVIEKKETTPIINQ